MSNEEKKPVGRPRVETKLPDGWRDIIIQSGKEGKHITDFIIILGISWDAHWAMMDRNKDYNRAVKDYEKYCEQYWFEQMRVQMEETGGAGYNSRLWSLIMRNKFGDRWSEASKVDLTSKGEQIETKAPIQIEIIKKSLNEDTDAQK